MSPYGSLSDMEVQTLSSEEDELQERIHLSLSGDLNPADMVPASILTTAQEHHSRATQVTPTTASVGCQTTLHIGESDVCLVYEAGLHCNNLLLSTEGLVQD